MPLVIGSRLGGYEIVGSLGQGGMGEVYRARDTRLHRDVAIKVLPDLFASDPERLVRFEREAQTLAALNHPGIAHIYGVIDLAASGGEGLRALVMECVEGEDLAHRIARGRIPGDEAIQIARQIADAVEAAHERGIVHRDLKPANVRLAPDGTVKVLDFGLAKAMETIAAEGASLANSPTFTSPAMTAVGVILGTAAYMAPEQARGKAVDRRADVWAFGCLLYELLTGAKPFGGETVTDVMSAIVSKEPDWTRLPPDTPEALRALLGRCLEKDPRRRLRDIGEARVVLERPLDPQPRVTGPPASRGVPLWLTALLGVLAAVLAIAVGVLVARRASGSADASRALTRYDLQLPDATLDVVFRPALSVSADGATFAFVGNSGGVNRIYVRSRGDAVPHVLPGSERGRDPAVSPDGRWVVFYTDASIRKASIDGGATVIGSGRDVRGITWADAATLILAPDSAAPLSTMPSAGGAPRTLTSLAPGERTHRWPDALPGGKAVLFTVGTVGKPDTYDQGFVDLVVVATGERRHLVEGAAMARFCGSHVVYARGPSLFAVPFDVERLQVTGAAVEIVQGVERDASTGAVHFDCSDEGTLAYVPGLAEGDLHVLTWRDREGHAQAVNLPAGPYQEARMSPDGSRVALLSGTAGAGDVWIHDFGAGTFTRLTFTGDCAAPIWSPDGQTVYYSTFDASGTGSKITRKRADGSREPEALRPWPGRVYLASVDEARGFSILDSVTIASDRGDVLRVPLAPAGAPQPLVSTPANEFAANVSADGRWLAYESDSTGRPEVYVVDLSGTGARYQVTSTGAEEPHWSRDSRELYFRSANRLLAVPVATEPSFRAGQARPLFDGVYNSGIESGRSYDVDAKNGRFLLVVRAAENRAPMAVRVVVNWDATLGSR
jgi:serine/threonine-protein kinase